MNLPDLNFETSLLPSSCRYLLGIDEVGRGPLAGPVTIGAFLLDLHNFNSHEFVKLGVRDSKLLSSKKRQSMFDYFQKNNFIFKTFSASSGDIDQQGIAVCIYSLMNQALKHFSDQFDFCLIDGSYDTKNILNINNISTSPVKGRWSGTHRTGGVRTLVKADQKCFSVAAASVCAKVVRDEFMEKLDQDFPQYGFATHKGYGTRLHLEAIKNHGPCPHHRMSFAPLKQTNSVHNL